MTKLVPPNPPPRYDNVFYEGVAWLNNLGVSPALSQLIVYGSRAREIPYNFHVVANPFGPR